MNLISINDYAKETGVSYEAIRKRVARYRSELKGHIIIDGRTQYLDEYAREFLEERRKRSPVIVRVEAADERTNELEAKVSDLEEQKEQLLKRVAALQEMIIDGDKKLIAANEQLLLEKDKVVSLLENKEENIKLRAERDVLTEKLSTAQEQRQTAEDTAQDAQKRLTDYESQVTQWQADYQQQLDELSRQRDAAVEEAASYEKSWFGFYRKR